MTYIRRKSINQEKRTAKEFRGRTQIASGAIETLKGDVRTGSNLVGKFNTDDFLIENKFTDADHYKLTLATWNKIAKEAFRDNFRTPLMQVDVKETQLVIFDKHVFMEMGFTASLVTATKAKSFMVKENIMEGLQDHETVEIHFNIVEKTSLFVMRKDYFISRLS